MQSISRRILSSEKDFYLAKMNAIFFLVFPVGLVVSQDRNPVLCQYEYNQSLTNNLTGFLLESLTGLSFMECSVR